MEPRKVQKVGHSTLSVSIPINWAKKNGIKKGDLIFISEENDGTLRLRIDPNTTEDSNIYVVNVDLCDNTQMLERIIVGNYVLGRNVIKVESSRRLMREQIESIRRVTQKLLGIGIIEESDRHLLLQCSIDPKMFPLSTVLRRLYVITSVMFKDALDGLIDGDIELAKDALTREHEADMFCWLLERLLASAQQSSKIANSIGIKEPMEIVHHNLIAWFLEMVGDRVCNLASNILRFQELQKKQGDNELTERLSQMALITFTMFDKAVKSIFDGKIKVASDAVDLHDAVEGEEKRLLKDFQNRTDPDLAAVVSSLAWELKIIAEHSSALAEIAINNVLKGENDICSVEEQTPPI